MVNRNFRWAAIIALVCCIFLKSRNMIYDPNSAAYAQVSSENTTSAEPAQFDLEPIKGRIPVCTVDESCTQCVEPHYPPEKVACLMRKRQSIDNSGAWSLPEGFMYKFDQSFANAVLDKIIGGASVLELGAGLGCYTTYFHESKKIPSIVGYEGASNVESLTDGFIHQADLTKKQDFGVQSYDWVVCMEVAEHIPPDFEHIFLLNLVSAAREGVLLSWGKPGQNGVGHVNLRTNEYVIDIMKSLGFDYDEERSEYLRSQATFHWFKGTTMVFVNSESF